MTAALARPLEDLDVGRGVAAPARPALERLRVLAARCRAKRRLDLFRACQMLSRDRDEAGRGQGLRATAAHSTLVLDDTNSTAILPDGSLGKGVTDVAIERSEDNDCSRLEAAHDGYVKGFGLLHQRRLSLGNDGKEVRGEDRLIAKGRRKIREAAPYAIRFHLAPEVEATITADGMGAILRSPGAPPWNFRCRGAMLQLEESLFVDGHGQLQQIVQLVVVGEVSAIGGEIAWQFRRSS